MAETERDIRAQQHQDRVDLTTNHEKEWTKFRHKQEEYNHKYGIGYAKILLSKERVNLENRFNQEISHLSEFHDQQWLDHENNASTDKPNSSPSPFRASQQLPHQVPQSLFRNPATDPHQVQDKMNNLLSIQKEKSTQKEIGETKESPMPMSIALRFNQSLSYTRAEENKAKTSIDDKGLHKYEGPDKG